MRHIGSLVFEESRDAHNRIAQVILDTDASNEYYYAITVNGTDQNGDWVAPHFATIVNYANQGDVTINIDGIETDIPPYSNVAFSISPFTSDIEVDAFDGVVTVYISEQRININIGTDQSKVGQVSGFLRRDGTEPMIGNLNMGNFDIFNIRNFLTANSPETYGAKADGVTDDTIAVQDAIDYVAGQGGGIMRLTPGKTYKITNVNVLTDKVVIDARGATITSASVALAATLTIAGANCKVLGGRWVLTGGTDNPWHFNITGLGWELDGCHLIKTPDAGHYQIYIRHTADNGYAHGIRYEGSNGTYWEASGCVFTDFTFIGRATGGDDCFAFKSISDNCRNNVIGNGTVENYYDLVAFGSEIGGAAAVTGYGTANSRTVGNIAISNVVMKNCAGIAYFKPGAIGDYRDGTIEDIDIGNIELNDELGTKFISAFPCTPNRGGRLLRINIHDIAIKARCQNTVAPKRGMLEILFGTTNNGTAAPTINGLTLTNVRFFDPFDGVANGVGGAPGYPVTNIISFEQGTVGVGTAANIRLDNVRGNGCEQAGISIVNPGFNDAVSIDNLVLDKTGNTTGAFGAFYIGARVRIGVNIAINNIVNGNPYVLEANNGEIVSLHDKLFYNTNLGGGIADSQAAWVAPVRCYVHKVDIIVNFGVAQSDVNYTTLNMYNGPNNFHGPNTKATGGTEFANLMTLATNAIANMLLSRSIANAANQGFCYFAKDAVMTINKNDTGAGAPLQYARMRVHYAPY